MFLYYSYLTVKYNSENIYLKKGTYIDIGIVVKLPKIL